MEPPGSIYNFDANKSVELMDLPRENHGLANPHGSPVRVVASVGCLSRHRGGHGIPFLTSPISTCSIRVAATHGNKSPLQVATVLLQLNACQLWEQTSPFPRVSSHCQTHPGHTVRPWTIHLQLGVATDPIQAIQPTPNPNPCGYDFKGLLACQRCVPPLFPVVC